MTRTEADPKFRNKMFALIGVLLIGYIGIKSWHVSVALGAYQGQVIKGDLSQAAK